MTSLKFVCKSGCWEVNGCVCPTFTFILHSSMFLLPHIVLLCIVLVSLDYYSFSVLCILRSCIKWPTFLYFRLDLKKKLSTEKNKRRFYYLYIWSNMASSLSSLPSMVTITLLLLYHQMGPFGVMSNEDLILPSFSWDPRNEWWVFEKVLSTAE